MRKFVLPVLAVFVVAAGLWVIYDRFYAPSQPEVELSPPAVPLPQAVLEMEQVLALPGVFSISTLDVKRAPTHPADV